MEQILAFIQQYGLPVFVIATCIIVFLGILKLCKVFAKVTNKNVKKLIYYTLDIALSFGGTAIYFAIFKLSFANYLVFSASQISATTTLYAIYENFGIRKLVQIALDGIAKMFKSNDAFKKLAEKLGVAPEDVDNLKNQLMGNLEKASKKEQKEAEKQAIEALKQANKEVKLEQKQTEEKKVAEAKAVVEQEKAKANDALKAKVAIAKSKISTQK